MLPPEELYCPPSPPSLSLPAPPLTVPVAQLALMLPPLPCPHKPADIIAAGAAIEPVVHNANIAQHRKTTCFAEKPLLLSPFRA